MPLAVHAAEVWMANVRVVNGASVCCRIKSAYVVYGTTTVPVRVKPIAQRTLLKIEG